MTKFSFYFIVFSICLFYVVSIVVCECLKQIAKLLNFSLLFRSLFLMKNKQNKMKSRGKNLLKENNGQRKIVDFTYFFAHKKIDVSFLLWTFKD